MTVSNEHGYVDEEGNVFLNTPSGAVKISQYTVGTPAEGLAFFAKRFEDLVAEIELAIMRLKDGKANSQSVKILVDKISGVIDSPNLLGNIELLSQKKEELLVLLQEHKAKASAEKAEAKAITLAKREEIVAAAEKLASSTAWKATSEKFKELLEEWKLQPKFDRGIEQELWKRFSTARSAFDKARRAHFASLDQLRIEASEAKAKLIAKANDLADSNDWAATTTAFKQLMDDWKSIARAGKSDEERLWAEFKSAQEKFFTARNAANDARDEELGKNLEAKLALVAQAEALLPINDVEQTKRALRDISTQWDAIGHVPRNDKEKIERRLKAVEDALRAIQEEQWRKSKPEVIERANTLVASFEASLSKLNVELEAATKAQDKNKIAKLEAQIAQTSALLEAARSGASQFSS